MKFVPDDRPLSPLEALAYIIRNIIITVTVVWIAALLLIPVLHVL
jgi:hypothetical protein